MEDAAFTHLVVVGSSAGDVEALHQNEARWRALIDKGANVITISDREGIVRFASPSVETVCGYAAEEFVGTHMFEAGRIHPEDLERCEEAFRELAGSPDSSIDIQHRYLHKSGGWRWLEGTFTSLFHDPAIGGLVANFRDITKRKEAEEALRESEERYRSLFGSIGEGFCTIEVLFDENEKPVDYRFLEVNPSFDKQTGIDNAVGRRMREIAPQHEEHWFEVYGRVALTGEPIRFESRAEQLHRWYDVYAFRVQEPELRRVDILFKDITERKRAETALRESEEWLRLAERAARSGTWEWNLLSDEIRWSDEHRELFGFAQEGPVTREGWWAAVHPEDLPRIEEAGKRCSEEGEQWPEIEYRILRDGETRWISARGRTVRDDEGGPARILGISVDVTERKAAEEERDRLRVLRRVARAEVAERERISRELHDRVAHSMGVAHQSLQLYEVFERSDPSQAAAKLDLAKRMTETALESTRNLSMELRRSEAEEGLVEALRNLLDVSVPEGMRAELLARGEESQVPLHVRGQLLLILCEAVRNAVAHSGAGRITVVLDVTPERVVGRVEDDGCGLPRENGAAEDSGVGMRSMRERAALVGGDVVIASDPGGGTKVEASIPSEEA
jgi:PAS domain S-box-containing protein